jgi:hypothetical protein
MRPPEVGKSAKLIGCRGFDGSCHRAWKPFLTVSAPADARLLVVVLRVSLVPSRRADKGLPDRLLPLMPLFHPPRADFKTHGDTGQLTERDKGDF